MAKCLVTGATGFIGRRLVEHLIAGGDEVTCLVRSLDRSASLAHLPVRRVVGDVSNRDGLREAVAGQDVVYHLAGLVRAARSADFYRTNGEGAAHLADACA